MKLKIKTDHVDLTKENKEYLTKKINKVEKFFKDKDINVKVLVSFKKNIHSVEVCIPTQRLIIRAESHEKDFNAAVDNVMDKLIRQITKNKEKMKKRYKEEDNFDIDTNFDTEDNSNTSIVRRKTISSKPMDEEEAVIQLELLGHDFLVFKNIDEECVSVLYKRKDEQIGILNVK